MFQKLPNRNCKELFLITKFLYLVIFFHLQVKNGTVKEEIAEVAKFELLEPLEVLEAYEETLVDDVVDKQIEVIQVPVIS